MNEVTNPMVGFKVYILKKSLVRISLKNPSRDGEIANLDSAQRGSGRV
jgi:hypothetical protein